MSTRDRSGTVPPALSLQLHTHAAGPLESACQSLLSVYPPSSSRLSVQPLMSHNLFQSTTQRLLLLLYRSRSTSESVCVCLSVTYFESFIGRCLSRSHNTGPGSALPCAWCAAATRTHCRARGLAWKQPARRGAAGPWSASFRSSSSGRCASRSSPSRRSLGCACCRPLQPIDQTKQRVQCGSECNVAYT